MTTKLPRSHRRVFDRRSFLKAVGLASQTLWLPSLGCADSAGTPSVPFAPEGPPRRLLLFFTQHGTWYDNWKMHGLGQGLGRRWGYDLGDLTEDQFSAALRPLHPWRSRMSVVDGLALISGETDRSGLRHQLGHVHSMTGASAELIGGLPMQTAASIDQIVAEEIARADRLRSLELSVGFVVPAAINSAGYLRPLPAESDPTRTFQRLFGTQASPSQASVLDLVGEGYDDVLGGLSSEDRARVSVHHDMVRDLERQISNLASSACEHPPAEPERSNDYVTIFENQLSLIRAAFSCDLTRVATLNMGMFSPARLRPGTQGNVHADFAHYVYADPDAAAAMTEYTRLHAEDFAAVLSALDAVPEGDGTLLDNTTVVWCGELADGAHGYERWPIIVAGGRGMRLGRYEFWPSVSPFAGWSFGGRLERMAEPHQRFLTTIARSFGVELDSMPVTEIVGIGGQRIDCTGHFPDLLA